MDIGVTPFGGSYYAGERPDSGLMAAILEAFGSGVVAFDREHRILVCNSRARDLLSLEHNCIGAKLVDVVPEPLATEAARAHATSDTESVAHLVRSNGRAIRWRTRQIDERHRVVLLDEVRASEHAAENDTAALDPLTGLGNRDGFSRASTCSVKPDGALILLDLDRFKQVNDSLGHPAGDAVLRLVGQRIASTLRAQDRAFRLGGDEFAIVMSDGLGAQSLAERVIDLLSRSYLVNGQVAIIGASAGIAYAADLAANGMAGPEALVQCADMALYAAKVAGRGTVRAFQPEMARSAQARHKMEQDLRVALARNQFELFYQPQADLETRALVGVEALLRWRHPEQGLIPPDSFIPLAEQTRLIIPIGEWALRAACREAQSWPVPLPIAVNVSALQLTDHKRFCRTVEKALRASGLDPTRLELEITESVLVGDTRAMLETFATLRASGVRITMDDFGTGYSSLSQLRSFPFDKLKIDRSFVRDLSDGTKAVAVVRAIAALGRSLGMRTIAEGVETHEQADQVRAEGCTQMQGYLLSRPVPAAELAVLFTKLHPCNGKQA